MIKLRRLLAKDAPMMLEWMHDAEIIQHLQTDFQSKTITDCIAFIDDSQDNLNSVHLAVTNDDEYMGTVSLRNIIDKTAEFAITMRKKALGKGYSAFAMQEIMKMAFEDMKLECIYWCVSPSNQRAIRFYDKNGYQRFNLNECKKIKCILTCGGGDIPQNKSNTFIGTRRRIAENQIEYGNSQFFFKCV